MKKLLLILAMIFCFVSLANAWDDGGWDQSRVPYTLRTVAPTVNDSDFPVPLLWCDTSADKIYILIDNSSGAAIWQEVIYSGGTPSFATVDLTGVTDGNLPYMQAGAAGFGDSPLSTDGTDLTVGNDINITGNIEAATYGSGANPNS